MDLDMFSTKQKRKLIVHVDKANIKGLTEKNKTFVFYSIMGKVYYNFFNFFIKKYLIGSLYDHLTRL